MGRLLPEKWLYHISITLIILPHAIFQRLPLGHKGRDSREVVECLHKSWSTFRKDCVAPAQALIKLNDTNITSGMQVLFGKGIDEEFISLALEDFANDLTEYCSSGEFEFD